MTNINSCCIVLCNKNNQSVKIKTNLINLLNRLIKEVNVVNFYFYDIYECEDWLLTELSKLKTFYPKIKFLNNKTDDNFQLSKHRSPLLNTPSFKNFEDICLEHYKNYTNINLKYCQIINQSQYVIFIDFDGNCPLTNSYLFACEKENCNIFRF